MECYFVDSGFIVRLPQFITIPSLLVSTGVLPHLFGIHIDITSYIGTVFQVDRRYRVLLPVKGVSLIEAVSAGTG
jgi:hypothetical protein